MPRRRDLLAGARAMAPWLVGIAPYGLVIGMSSATAGMPTLAGWLTGPLLYSGSSQVALIELVDAGAAPAVAVGAVLAINLRLVLYSATMAPYWQGTSRRWRALAAALLVDPSLAVGVDGYAATSGDLARGHRRYLGGALLLGFAWLTAIAVGAVAGGLVPAGLRLEFVIPLFLAGEVVKRTRGPSATRAAVVASVVAVVAVSMPLHLGPVVAMVAGVAAGLVTRESAS